MTRLAPILLAACGTLTTGYAPLTATTRPPRPAASVDVFLSGRPPAPVVELGIVEAHEAGVQLQPYGGERLTAVMARIRDAAGTHGCDAIAVNPPQIERNHWLVTATCLAYADRLGEQLSSR
jgi:hypothetical protein